MGAGGASGQRCPRVPSHALGLRMSAMLPNSPRCHTLCLPAPQALNTPRPLALPATRRCLDNAVMVFTSTRQEVDEQWGL